MPRPRWPRSASAYRSHTLAAQLRDASAGAEHRHPRHPGAARTRQARHHGALHPRCHQDDPGGHEPARALARCELKEGCAACVKRGGRVPSGAGGRGYLPRPWSRLAQSQCRSCEPRPIKGHVGHRELPHGGSRRACRALRGLRAHAHRLQLLPQPPLSQVPGRGGQAMAGRAPGRAVAGAVLSRGVHAAGADRRHRLSEQGGDLRHPVQGRRPRR